MATIASSLFAQTGKEIVAPRINRLLDRLERQYKTKVLPKKSHVRNYWSQEYKRLSVLNSVVFGNSQRQLQQVYVPISIVTEGDNKIIAINDYPQALMNIYNRIIIKDSIGMGKSTMMKIMFLNVIDEEKGFPIYVELRNLSEERNLIQEILSRLSSINNPFGEQLLLDLIAGGGFIFFFDGLDEIDLDCRDIVIKDIQDFISKAGNSQFVMTSRNDEALAGFGNFKGCNIQVPNSGDICSILLRYGENSDDARELVRKVRKKEYQGIDDFLNCPLLLGLLFRAYMERRGMELKLYQLCCNIFPVFFEQHDKTKDGAYSHDKRCRLDAYDMERILRVMGFYCVAKNRYEFSYDDFNGLIGYAKEQCTDLDFPIDGYREDVIKSVPIFCKDGYTYRWMHHSLCAYYAARYIYLDGKKNLPLILGNLSKSKSVRNYELVMAMYAEMDINGFVQYLVKPKVITYKAQIVKKECQSVKQIEKDNFNDACIINLIHQFVPQLFKEDGELDINEIDNLSCGYGMRSTDDSIENLIKEL